MSFYLLKRLLSLEKRKKKEKIELDAQSYDLELLVVNTEKEFLVYLHRFYERETVEFIQRFRSEEIKAELKLPSWAVPKSIAFRYDMDGVRLDQVVHPGKLPWKICRKEQIENAAVQLRLSAKDEAKMEQSEKFSHWLPRKEDMYRGETSEIEVDDDDEGENDEETIKRGTKKPRLETVRHGNGAMEWAEPPHGEGDSYYGQWHNDQPEKLGVFVRFDGESYCGEWKRGRFHGFGVYRYSNQHPQWPCHRYEGGYFENRRSGSGIYHFGISVVDLRTTCSGMYVGEWFKGNMHNYGAIIYSNGESYSGQWYEDQKQGLGMYIWANAGSDNTIYKDNDYFMGQFKCDAIQGLGAKFYVKDNRVYKGQWRNGKKHGYGIMWEYNQGITYYGKWENDEMHGAIIKKQKSVELVHQTLLYFYDHGIATEYRSYRYPDDYEDFESRAHEAHKQVEKVQQKVLEAIKCTRQVMKRTKQSQLHAYNKENQAKGVATKAFK